jgi:tetratricopeptide (TPR) repeat protein
MSDTATLYAQTLEAMRGPDAEKAYALASNLSHTAPENGEYQRMAGVSALAAQRAAEARGHFSQALRLDPGSYGSVAAWSGIAHAALIDDDPESAASLFRRALSLEPQFAPALAGLGQALVMRGQSKAGEDTLRRALALGMNSAKVQTFLARALLDRDEISAAEAALQSALELDPGAVPPRFLLGTVAKVEGRLEEARQIYRAVLGEHPWYSGYGEFAALKTFVDSDEDFALMLEALDALPESSPAAARADLHFALAKAYDDIGDIGRASEHLHAANAIELERVSRKTRTAKGTARMGRIEKIFTRTFIKRNEATGFVGVSPIFVVSLPRSGSTLMEQMLASHSRINGGGELAHFSEVANTLSLRWGAREDFPDIPDRIAASDLREAGREYGSLTARLRLLTPYFTDKSLMNFQYIGLIRMMLPEAKVVHMRRHPLAVALGLYRQRFARAIDYSFDLDEIVRHYRAYATLMAHWRAVVPQAFIEVFYEALVGDPERELRRVFDYLGLDFEPASLDFHRLERPVQTASVAQVREPLNTRGIHRHERYSKLLAPVAEALAEDISDYERALSVTQSSQDAQHH